MKNTNQPGCSKTEDNRHALLILDQKNVDTTSIQENQASNQEILLPAQNMIYALDMVKFLVAVGHSKFQAKSFFFQILNRIGIFQGFSRFPSQITS